MSTQSHNCRSVGSRAWAAAALALSAAGVASASMVAGAPAPEDPWAAFRPLVGHWRGEVEGLLGHGTAVREYDFLFGERYLVSRHASVRLPQEQSPDGDHHRELAIFSHDRSRGVIVLREFNVEGYVLQYRCAVEPSRFVCTTEQVENGDGLRARVTIEIRDRYRFEEVFELAPPGEELRHYLTVRWTRAPDARD